MSARKSRTRAAVVAAGLGGANAFDAIAWPARLDSRRANGLATRVLCNVAPAGTVVAHDLTFQRSWLSRCFEHGEESRVVLCQSCRCCRLQTRRHRCQMPCRRALRQRDGHHESALRRILAADHVVAERVTPQLAEGIDGQRKQRDAAVVVGWALKFFLRFVSQVRGIGDH
eukprot:1011082-Pleurochrysis_carterae.AAC.1